MRSLMSKRYVLCPILTGYPMFPYGISDESKNAFPTHPDSFDVLSIKGLTE